MEVFLMINDNNKSSENLSPSDRFSSMMILYLVFFILFNFLIAPFVPNSNDTNLFSNAFASELKNSNYNVIESQTTFRCINYTPIFTKEGVKQYEVRFKTIGSDFSFSVVVPAAEIDEFKNIEKDAKYEGTISYMYVDKAFSNITKDLNDEQRNNRIISLLNSSSDYSKFGTISKISFMYSNYLEEYSQEEATAYLDKYINSLINTSI